MGYCGPRGLPRSEFLGWDKDDRDAALVWLLRHRQQCPSCGTRPDEFDTEQGGHPRAYVATVHRCPGCAVLDNRRGRFDKDREKGNLPPGAHLVLRRQDTKEQSA